MLARTGSLIEGRYFLSATTVKNFVIFAGGVAPSGTSSKMDIYNYDTGIWTTGDLSVARIGLGATAVGSSAFFAGGSGTTGIVAVVDVFTTCSSYTDCDDGKFCNGIEFCTYGYCGNSAGNPCLS